MTKQIVGAIRMVAFAGLALGLTLGARAADVAKIEETAATYPSLQDAVTAATAGQTVTLLAATSVDTAVTVSKDLTLNLGGKTLTRSNLNNSTAHGAAFDISAATVTITNGTIKCASIYADAILAENGAQLTLDDLVVRLNAVPGSCVYADGSSTAVTINGGSYKNQDTSGTGTGGSLLNMMCVNTNSTGTVTIGGGFFYGMNPADGGKSQASYLASGKYAYFHGLSTDATVFSYWEVRSGSPVAQIGSVPYDTLADAVAAAKAGDRVDLLQNVAIDAAVTVGKSIAINLGSKTVTRSNQGVTAANHGAAFDVTNGTVTITNGSVKCASVLGDALLARASAALTLDDLVVQINSATGSCVYALGSSTVTINGGSYRNQNLDGTGTGGSLPHMMCVNTNSTGTVTISAGAFYGKNPAEGGANQTTYLADGKYAFFKGLVRSATTFNYWSVSATVPAVTIRGAAFTDLAFALANYTATGDVITVCKDLTLSEKLTIPETVTLDLNGKTLTPAAAGLVNNGTIVVYDYATVQSFANLPGTLKAGATISNQVASVTVLEYPEGTTVRLATNVFTRSSTDYARDTVSIVVPDDETLVWRLGVSAYRQLYVSGDVTYAGDLAAGYDADAATRLSVTGDVTLASNVVLSNYTAVAVDGAVTPGDYHFTLAALTAELTVKTALASGAVVSAVTGYQMKASESAGCWVYSLEAIEYEADDVVPETIRPDPEKATYEIEPTTVHQGESVTITVTPDADYTYTGVALPSGWYLDSASGAITNRIASYDSGKSLTEKIPDPILFDPKPDAGAHLSGGMFEPPDYVVGEEFVTGNDDSNHTGVISYWYTQDTEDFEGVIEKRMTNATEGVKVMTFESNITNPLYRTIYNSKQKTRVQDFTTHEIGAGLFVDTQVKLSPYLVNDLRPMPLDESLLGTTNIEKLVVWVRVTDNGDESRTTNLVASAGYYTNATPALAVKHYEMALPSSVDYMSLATNFHRLTIKAFNNISTDEANLKPAFVVYLDEQLLTYADAEAMGDTVPTLTMVAAKYYRAGCHALLPSLQTGLETATKITSLGYSGMGSIQDVYMDDYYHAYPQFAADEFTFNLAWTEGVKSLKFDTFETNNLTGAGMVSFSLPPVHTNALVFDVAYDTANSYKGKAGIWYDSTGALHANDGSNSVDRGVFDLRTAADRYTVAAFKANYTLGGQEFMTLYGNEFEEGALAYAKRTGTPFALAGNLTLSSSEATLWVTNNETLVIDLKGHTLKGGTAGQPTLFNNGGALIVTNSTVEIGAVVAAEGATVAVALTNGTTTVYGGKFETFAKEEAATLALAGGTFLDTAATSAASAFYLAGCEADGFTTVHTVESAAHYFSVYPAVTATLAVDHATVAVVQGVASVSGSANAFKVASGLDFTATYTAADYYKFFNDQATTNATYNITANTEFAAPAVTKIPYGKDDVVPEASRPQNADYSIEPSEARQGEALTITATPNTGYTYEDVDLSEAAGWYYDPQTGSITNYIASYDRAVGVGKIPDAVVALPKYTVTVNTNDVLFTSYLVKSNATIGAAWQPLPDLPYTRGQWVGDELTADTVITCDKTYSYLYSVYVPEPTYDEHISSGNFEPPDYVVDSAFVTGNDDSNHTGMVSYWFTADKDDLEGVILTNETLGAKVMSFECNITNTLYRTIYNSKQKARVEDFKTHDIGAALFLDTEVQLTPYHVNSIHPAPVDESLVGTTDGDKLAVWIRTTDGENDTLVTNLVVSAGYYAATGANPVTLKHYEMALPSGLDYPSLVTNFHRLTIKAFDTIATDGVKPAFVVYLDQKLLTYGDSEAMGATTPTLTTIAAKYYRTGCHALLPSLHTGLDTATTITSLGYSGTGAIKEVAMDDYYHNGYPEFASDDFEFDLAWTDGVTSFKYGDFATNNLTGAGSMPMRVSPVTTNLVVFDVAYDTANGYKGKAGIWYDSKNALHANDGSNSVDRGVFDLRTAAATYTIAAFKANYTVDGQEFMTLLGNAFEEGALAYAKRMGKPFVLPRNLTIKEGTGTIAVGSGETLVIDLAGHTLQGGVEGQPTLFNNGGTLIVTNSTVAIGQVLAATNTTVAVALTNGTTTVYGGKFETFAKEEAATLALAGGTYLDTAATSAESAFYLAGCEADGFASVHEVDEEKHYFTVYPAVTATISAPHASVIVTQGVGVVTGDVDGKYAVATGIVFSVTYVADANWEYEGGVTTVTTNFTLFADAAISAPAIKESFAAEVDGTKYTTLAAALEAVKSSDTAKTILVLHDTTLPTAFYEIKSGLTITATNAVTVSLYGDASQPLYIGALGTEPATYPNVTFTANVKIAGADYTISNVKDDTWCFATLELLGEVEAKVSIVGSGVDVKGKVNTPEKAATVTASAMSVTGDGTTYTTENPQYTAASFVSSQSDVTFKNTVVKFTGSNATENVLAKATLSGYEDAEAYTLLDNATVVFEGSAPIYVGGSKNETDYDAYSTLELRNASLVATNAVLILKGGDTVVWADSSSAIKVGAITNKASQLVFDLSGMKGEQYLLVSSKGASYYGAVDILGAYAPVLIGNDLYAVKPKYQVVTDWGYTVTTNYYFWSDEALRYSMTGSQITAVNGASWDSAIGEDEEGRQVVAGKATPSGTTITVEFTTTGFEPNVFNVNNVWIFYMHDLVQDEGWTGAKRVAKPTNVSEASAAGEEGKYNYTATFEIPEAKDNLFVRLVVSPDVTED